MDRARTGQSANPADARRRGRLPPKR